MRINQLTSTRFVAAMAIVVFHFGRNRYPFDSDKISFLIQYSDVAVSYFFVLSGFIMIVAYGKQTHVSAPEYLRNRFVRIYPLYLFALMLFMGVELYIGNPIALEEVVGNITMLQSWIPDMAITLNYPGWSLSVEMFFYALFPLLFNKVYVSGARITYLFGISFWAVTQIFLHVTATDLIFSSPPISDIRFINYFPVTHVNQFILGNVAGIYFMRNQQRRGVHDLKILVLIGVLVFLLMGSWSWLHYHNGILGLVFAPIVVLMSLNTGFITRMLDNSVAVFLGEISFGIYILQVPVFAGTYYLLVQTLELRIFSNQLFYISCSILILIAALAYVFVEKPAREWLRVGYHGSLKNESK